MIQRRYDYPSWQRQVAWKIKNCPIGTISGECFRADPPRGRPAGLRFASPLHEKQETPGALRPGIEVCIALTRYSKAQNRQGIHLRNATGWKIAGQGRYEGGSFDDFAL